MLLCSHAPFCTATHPSPNMYLIQLSLAFLLSSCVICQNCDELTDVSEIEELIAENRKSNPGDGPDFNVEITLLDDNIVCLAPSDTQNKYRFVSIVAQYRIRIDGGPTDTEIGQYEFECTSTSRWSVTGTDIGSRVEENREFPVDASLLNATRRTDCFICINPINSLVDIFLLQPDEVSHCAGELCRIIIQHLQHTVNFCFHCSLHWL